MRNRGRRDKTQKSKERTKTRPGKTDLQKEGNEKKEREENAKENENQKV